METFNFADRMFMDYFNLQPSVVNGSANVETEVYRRYLFTKIFSCYKFKLPKEWKINFFRYFLFYCGSIAAIYTKEFGWVCQPYGIERLGLYYNPTHIIVYNQHFKTAKRGIIGVNAQIIHLMDDFFGLYDLVTKYAYQFAALDKSFDINLMNSNVSVLIEASSKKEADEIKEAYHQATTGKPFVPLNRELLKGESLKPLISGVKSNYIANDLLTSRRQLMNQFLTEIGIHNTNYEKKAQMNSDEVNRGNEEQEAIIMVIYDNLKSDFADLKKISGLDVGVELRYNYEEVSEIGQDYPMGNVSIRT